MRRYLRRCRSRRRAAGRLVILRTEVRQGVDGDSPGSVHPVEMGVYAPESPISGMRSPKEDLPMKLLARVFAAAVTCATVALPLVAADAPSASAAPTWAPAATAPIHPGVQTITAGGQCTANFVFFDASNTVYIGHAAHCSGTGGNTATNGCTSGSLPIGTQVQVTGASQPGVMVYNSWLTMQGLGEADANTCQFNDLALIKLNPADFGKVNPSIPFWGGPNGIDANGTVQGESVYSYGNSELRGGISQLSPKQGVSLGDGGGGWSHNVFTASPRIPRASGRAILNSTR